MCIACSGLYVDLGSNTASVELTNLLGIQICNDPILGPALTPTLDQPPPYSPPSPPEDFDNYCQVHEEISNNKQNLVFHETAGMGSVAFTNNSRTTITKPNENIKFDQYNGQIQINTSSDVMHTDLDEWMRYNKDDNIAVNNAKNKHKLNVFRTKEKYSVSRTSENKNNNNSTNKTGIIVDNGTFRIKTLR